VGGDNRDVLEVLKLELEFLKTGGYVRSPREPWRPQFFFEDSPTCMNYDCKAHPAPCVECVLMQFVPEEQRHERYACRLIPLSAAGENLDALYRWGTQLEAEQALAGWLAATIQQLERERALEQAAQRRQPESGAPAASAQETVKAEETKVQQS